MSNLITIPTAMTHLYNRNNRSSRIKPNINEVINLVYNRISKMTAGQSKNLNKRLKICDELIKLLPSGKHNLLQKYSDLYAVETNTILEAAVRYMLTNENEVSEAL